MHNREPLPQGIPASLSNALDRHFVTCAAVAAAAAVTGLTGEAHADLVYSGTQNLVLPNEGGGGLYINLVTKAYSTDSSVQGWDLNPYVNGWGSGNFFGFWSPTDGTQFVQSPSGGADIANLTAGTSIGPDSPFFIYPLSSNSYYGFMSNATAGAWNEIGTGYIGVKFSEDGVNGGNPVYGWVQISKTVAGEPALGDPSGITLIDWAYDDSGAPIVAGATVAPEPSSLALLAAGAMGLLARRGQVKLRKNQTVVA